MKKLYRWLFVGLVGGSFFLPVSRAESGYAQRWGLAAGGEIGSGSDNAFTQVEFLIQWSRAPAMSTARWTMAPVWLVGAGYLEADSESSLVMGAGPGVRFTYRNRLIVDLGSRLSYLEHPTFSTRNLGGNIQFISHIGLAYRLTARMGVGARVQHQSNAGIDKPNPGLNTGLIEFFCAW